MIYRVARITDIDQLHEIRLSVRENRLSSPSLVTEAHYKSYLTAGGKGWVCEEANFLVGFAIINTTDRNIWALFIHPEWEGRGIGKKLHWLMLHWYFTGFKDALWLNTGPNTKAAGFYRHLGWTEKGREENGELRMEMTYDRWKKRAGNEKQSSFD